MATVNQTATSRTLSTRTGPKPQGIQVGDMVRATKGKVPGKVLKLADGMATVQWQPKLIGRTAEGSKTTEPVAKMTLWTPPTA